MTPLQQMISDNEREFERRCGEELGWISSVFMSQGDTRAGDIIMPTEELLKTTEELIRSFHSQQLRLIEEVKRMAENNKNRDWFRGKWGKGYNQALDDFISNLEEVK